MIRAAGMLLLSALQGAAGGGSIRLHVMDQTTGQPVPGAIIALTDVQRAATANADGRLAFSNVPPGPQHVSIRRLGYAPRVLHALVAADGSIELTVALTPLPTRLGRIRVESPLHATVRDREPDDVGDIGDRVLSFAAIHDHPLLPEPDALLAVVGGHVTANPESPDGLHVMGGASDHLAYLIDGIPVLSPYHDGGVFGALNPDAISRLSLQVSPQSALRAEALSGVLSASTRAVPDDPQAAGGVSDTQLRLTLETPLRRNPRPDAATERDRGEDGPAGLLVSGRLLFPGLLGQKPGASQIDGDGADGVARLALPVGGGILRLLTVAIRSDVSLATRVSESDPAASSDPPRSDLAWTSASTGAAWERRDSGGGASVSVYRASSAADVDWLADSLPLVATSRLSSIGLTAALERADRNGAWIVGGRMQRLTSRYAVVEGSTSLRSLEARPLMSAVHAMRRQRLAPAIDLAAGTALLGYGNNLLSAPFAEVVWRAAGRVTLSASAGRRYQFTQSLRNPESLLSNVFPADVPVVADTRVPVAHSDEELVVGAFRPRAGMDLTIRGWDRHLEGLVLAAVNSSAPVVDGAIHSGRARARGLSLDAQAAGARFTFFGSYAWQNVRFVLEDTSWTPGSGATHTYDAGLLFFAGPATALRVSIAGAAGRRATGYSGVFEWESCNLRDRGCEFAGGPLRRDGALGGIRLPAYLRIDIGLRRHWHVRIAGRDAAIAAYATYSNLLDRPNALTVVRDPSTGTRSVIGMRPGSPLVVGIDWRF